MAKFELERSISKRGLLSRKAAALAIIEGKVKVNDQICKIPLTYFDSRWKIEIKSVGRLDQASEGLLFFSNDHVWAEKLMNPKTHVKKIIMYK